MKHTNIIRILFSAVILISQFSCRRVFDRAQWAPEASFPVAYAKLTINDLIQDSSQVKTDSTGLAVIVFKQKLDSLTLDVLDTFSAPPFNRKFKLDSLKLTVEPYTRVFTLGNLATSLIQSGDPVNAQYGYVLRLLQGKNIASLPFVTLPTFLSLPIGDLPLSLNQYFQEAELETGTMELSIENGFPMKINRMDFNIRNKSETVPLLEEKEIEINVNETFRNTYDLAGKKIEGDFIINIPVLDLLTDRNAVIDSNDAVTVKMIFSDLTVNSAIAVFPDQDVVRDRQSVLLENMDGLKLKEAIIEEGHLVMDVKSTIQDSIFITYSMPGAAFNGIPLVFEGVVPPADQVNASVVQLKVPVKDYLVNFSYPPEYYNRFLYDFRAHVKNTGKKVHLNLRDSIEVNVYLKGVRPKYARGYLGSLDTTISANVTSDLFSSINVTRFSPANVKLSLEVENGLGVNGSITLKKLTASGKDGRTTEANDPELIGKNFLIKGALYPPFRESVTRLSSSSTSNFSELISILPDKFGYEVLVNIGGDEHDTTQFVFSHSKLKPSLLIEVPLHLSVEGLVLRDTVDVNSATIEVDNNGGTLRLLSYNGFPLSASVTLTFIDVFGIKTVLQSTGIMEAADIDEESGRVKSQKYSKIEFPFDVHQLHIMSVSKKLVLETRFNTTPGKHVKIYSDYSSDMTLSAKFAPKLSR